MIENGNIDFNGLPRVMINDQNQIIGQKVEAIIHACSENQVHVRVCDPHQACVEQFGAGNGLRGFLRPRDGIIPLPIPNPGF